MKNKMGLCFSFIEMYFNMAVNDFPNVFCKVDSTVSAKGVLTFMLLSQGGHSSPVRDIRRYMTWMSIVTADYVPCMKMPQFLQLFSCGPTFKVFRIYYSSSNATVWSLLAGDMWEYLGCMARCGAAGLSNRPHDIRLVSKGAIPADSLTRTAKAFPGICPHQQVVLSDFLTFANLAGANGMSLLF